ncbi:hypothetical protein FQN54_001283 [Arachnomyces sp. PD_36]|nr:hypothetical protein FQN54_001283 [Arachnomyces sp. PD_36]
MASNLAGTVLPIVPSVNGQFIAGLFKNRLRIIPSTEPGTHNAIRIIDTKSRFTAFPRFIRWSPERTRILCASGRCISVWDLVDEKWAADIQDVDTAGNGGVINVEFGATHDEVIAFHAFNTKVTIFSLSTGQAQSIKSPKFSHSNGFAYRPSTGHLAILLKLDTVDTLTIHEKETYEVVNTVAVPTVDAQGLKWSPDGCWIAVWDTASMGTKVVIYTADGQLFKTFTGREEDFDLGVRVIAWSPTSHILGIGNYDGSVDFLGGDTLIVKMTIVHSVEENQRDTPDVWRERYTDADGLYHYGSAGDLLALPTGTTNSHRAVTLLEFNCTGTMLATLCHAFPSVVWIWSVTASRPKLTAVLVLENNVRQLLWNPVNPDSLLITNECHTPTVHEWVTHSAPKVSHVPIKPDGGKHEATWLKDVAAHSVFLFGSSREYVVGRISDGSEKFETVQSWDDNSSYISSSSRLFDTSTS